MRTQVYHIPLCWNVAFTSAESDVIMLIGVTHAEREVLVAAVTRKLSNLLNTVIQYKSVNPENCIR